MSAGRIESVRIRGFRSLVDVELSNLQNANVLIGARVWLFFVDDPGGLCEAACKGYLTRRRRGGDGGGGGSLTGGTVLSAYRWA